MDKLRLVGVRIAIIEEICEECSFNLSTSEKIFDFLIATYYENKTENKSEFAMIANCDAHVKSITLNDCEYYINLPKLLLVVIGILVDSNLTKGAIGSLCGLYGINNKVIYKMNQKRAEICLLREHMRNRRSVDFNYLIEHECVNNDLQCCFRNEDGLCCLTKEQIKSTIAHFYELGIM